ncbi:hypothetical protein [Nostoc sp. WHI]|uniref:hypothetical protein n=1 Tax=Nostoc sp. WHI TaxID=2650611 RepID=UPI001E63E845|nr:hypothetical protein [Nostoc sp. WHI]
MAAPMLAEFLGGDAFLGFIAAVSFATILAVVAILLGILFKQYPTFFYCGDCRFTIEY